MARIIPKISAWLAKDCRALPTVTQGEGALPTVAQGGGALPTVTLRSKGALALARQPMQSDKKGRGRLDANEAGAVPADWTLRTKLCQ